MTLITTEIFAFSMQIALLLLEELTAFAGVLEEFTAVLEELTALQVCWH